MVLVAPYSFGFLCAIVYTTINNDTTDIANNMKFSKFKKFLLLIKKAFVGLNSPSILLMEKSIKEDFLVKKSYVKL